MRKADERVTCICEECVPESTPYCWRCNRYRDNLPKCPWCGSPFDKPTITPAKYTVMGQDRYWGHMVCSNPECRSQSPCVYGTNPAVLASEAIAAASQLLLREPLTLQEAVAQLNAGDPIWIEERYSERDSTWFMPIGLNSTSIAPDFNYNCGVTWRPWASRPTPEEIAAAPWDGEPSK